jgi:hypothetical protein
VKRGPNNDTLALCALASAKLFDAQQWVWARRNAPYCDENLDVPDAERILHSLTEMVDRVMSDGGGINRTGRLMVEACEQICSGCDGVCVTVWQQLGEVEV